MPHWKNVWLTVWEKVKAFIAGAGKIIFMISIILWILGNTGPAGALENAENKARTEASALTPQDELNDLIAAKKLEASYAGILGKSIEPVIRPLGYDWKIGIALVTSFAAREVFVGTMATLYSVGDDIGENNTTLRQKMQNAVRSDGTKVYTLATGLSLMIFYLLAMQCMSTLAIIKRETKSWKWPIITLLYMTSLAYVISLLVYQLLKGTVS